MMKNSVVVKACFSKQKDYSHLYMCTLPLPGIGSSVVRVGLILPGMCTACQTVYFQRWRPQANIPHHGTASKHSLYMHMCTPLRHQRGIYKQTSTSLFCQNPMPVQLVEPTVILHNYVHFRCTRGPPASLVCQQLVGTQFITPLILPSLHIHW